MSLAPTLLPAVLDTLLGRLALLFLASTNGDMAAAREAAAQMLASYNPETEDELRLAANIISFSLHALEALSQAVTPGMPLNKILRLRSGAVSLSRESHKAERRLDQLRKARRDGTQPQPAEAQPAEPPNPRIDKAIALVEATRQQIETPENAVPVWSKAYRQQQAALRITENLKRNQAAHLAATNAGATQAAPARSL